MANPPIRTPGLGAGGVWQIDQLLSLGKAFVTGASALAQFQRDLRSWLAGPHAARSHPEPADVALTSLQTLIRHFVEAAGSTFHAHRGATGQRR